MHCNILINDQIDFEFQVAFYLQLPYHLQTITKLELSHLCGIERRIAEIPDRRHYTEM